MGPGQPARQPADQRGRHPARARRTSSTAPSRRTTPRTTASTSSSPELAQAHQRAVPGLGVQETNRTDIVTALLTGIPGLTQIAAEAGCGRHAEDQPRRAADGARQNRFGVLGRRQRGLPQRAPARRRRGRHRAARGRRVPADEGKKLPLGDGVDQNDKPFLSTFPYVAPPDVGLDSELEAHRAGPRADPGAAVTARRRGARRAVRRAPHAPARPMTTHPPLAPILLAPSPPRRRAARARRSRSSRRDRGRAGPARRRPRPARRRRRPPIAALQARRRAPDPTRATATPRSPTPTCSSVRETGDAVLLRARRRRARAARCARPARLRRSDRRGHARARPPRLPRRPALGAAAHRRGARRRRAARRDRRRAGRARPLRRGRRGRCSGWSTASRTSPPTRASRTSASCTATSPARASAMRLAVSAGGDAPENVAYVQTLLGNARASTRGDLGAAPARVPAARSRGFPGYVPARGRPRARGGGARPTCAGAIARLRGVVDAAAAAGVRGRARRGRARRRAGRGGARATSRWSAPRSGCCAANGVNTDVDLALFEADHGVAAREPWRWRARAWAEAPSVRSADALGWALTRAGQPARGAALGARARCGSARATRCSSTTPGMAARARGRRAARARAWLRARAGAQPALLAALRAAGARGAGGRCDEARARSSPRSLARSRARRRAAAAAHPLGNFSINHLTRRLGLAATAVDVRYMLDQAEIPTFQERGLAPRRGARAQARRGASRARVTVDGRPVPLHARAGRARSHSRPARAACARRAWSCALTAPARDAARRVAVRRRDVPRPRRLEGGRRRARRRHRRALDRAGDRPHRRPAPLPEGPADEPARRAHARRSRSRPARHA